MDDMATADPKDAIDETLEETEEEEALISESAKLFDMFANAANSIRKANMAAENAPHEEKVLRRFRTGEIAELFDVTEQHIRRLAKELGNGFPEGEVVGGNRRAFTLTEIHQMRKYFKEVNPEKYKLSFEDESALKTQILCVTNFKGGAGKTTTTIHLAQRLVLKGKRVLVIDNDSQGSLTGQLGYRPNEHFEQEDTLYPFIEGTQETLHYAIRKSPWHGLDFIPAQLGLYSSEFYMPAAQSQNGEYQFWRALSAGLESVADDYDVILFDNPPSLGYLALAAIYPATALIIPVPPAWLDFSSAAEFFTMLSEMFEYFAKFSDDPEYDFVRILLTNAEGDSASNDIEGWIREFFGRYVLTNSMPHSKVIKNAAKKTKTLYELETSDVPDRRSLNRALDAMNAVNDEIEELIHRAWSVDETSQ